MGQHASSDPQSFLNAYFDPEWRRLIAALFRDAIETGVRNPQGVVDYVKDAAEAYLDRDDNNDEGRTVILELLKWLNLDLEGALDYAVSLVQARRDEEKARSRQRLQHLPPTPGQLEWLRDHGHDGPLPTNRADADDLIERLESERGDGN